MLAKIESIKLSDKEAMAIGTEVSAGLYTIPRG